MAALNIWTEDFLVHPHDRDATGSLSILSMCNYLQAAASYHARSLGISIDDLHAEGYTWVLSRLNLRLFDAPGREDRVQVRTWPSGTDRLLALRDFSIRDGAGRTCGAAQSAWLILDLHRRRPVRLDPFVHRLRPFVGERNGDGGFKKLPALESAEREKRFQVRYRDLDINQHVNHVSIIEWLLEASPPALRFTARPVGLSVHFIGEVRSGETVVSAAQPIAGEMGSTFLHRLVLEKTGAELARARSSWQAI